jgi:hypothetical protein
LGAAPNTGPASKVSERSISHSTVELGAFVLSSVAIAGRSQILRLPRAHQLGV